MVLSKMIKEFSTDTSSTLSVPFKRIGLALGALTLTQWISTDVLHVPLGGIGVLAAGAGALWFSSSLKGSFKKPSTVKGWISRCNDVLSQFESLEDQASFLINAHARTRALEKIITRDNSQAICFVSTEDIALPDESNLAAAFSGIGSLNISYVQNLPVQGNSRNLPDYFYEQDAIIYFLPLPLRAIDLLWLENLPDMQPSWVMTTCDDMSSWPDQLASLKSQLPQKWKNRILKLDNSTSTIINILKPIRTLLNNPSKNFDSTSQRLLARLHLSWQADLEKIRREKFKNIQNRSQWLVAGAVFASPLPTTDVLSVAVVNGLMMQEMAHLWSCKLKPDLLQVVAKQLALAALAQGVVEWSGQALLSAAKLHGGTWLAAGSMQALSAAYLTRVVGRSMSDWMALNNGVSEPDLNLLKQQAPQLVANAMELEKVDWSSFIKQSTSWLKDPNSEVIFN